MDMFLNAYERRSTLIYSKEDYLEALKRTKTVLVSDFCIRTNFYSCCGFGVAHTPAQK